MSRKCSRKTPHKSAWKWTFSPFSLYPSLSLIGSCHWSERKGGGGGGRDPRLAPIGAWCCQMKPQISKERERGRAAARVSSRDPNWKKMCESRKSADLLGQRETPIPRVGETAIKTATDFSLISKTVSCLDRDWWKDQLLLRERIQNGSRPSKAERLLSQLSTPCPSDHCKQ